MKNVVCWAEAALCLSLIVSIIACSPSEDDQTLVTSSSQSSGTVSGADASSGGFGTPHNEPNGADDDQSPPQSVKDPSDNTSKSPQDEPGSCQFSSAVEDLPTCCDNGAARCLPSDGISEGLKALVAECDGGGACVPEDILLSMQNTGKYEPKVCQSLSGEGRCVSLCVPMVAQYKDLLPQDVCSESERCTPCISPLDNKPTGACSGAITCNQPSNEQKDDNESPSTSPESEPAEPQSCDNPPDIDASVFPECECSGTRCVPNDLATPEQKKLLASCDNNQGVCVPEIFVKTGGLYTPTKCQSVGGAEGRCLSTCLPDVAKKAAYLPSAGCNDGEVCSPCCDPFTGESTGACDQECDSGPEAQCPGVSKFEQCCDDGTGQCVDKDMIPTKQQTSLKKCGPKKKQLCLPKELQDPSWGGSKCTGTMWINGESYKGVCLPECLKVPKLFLDKTVCPANFVCTPCTNALTGESTGAPGCP